MPGRTLADEIADDVGTIFTNPEDFGQVVVHRPRSGTSVSINGVFNQTGIQSGLKDDRQGRSNDSSGVLLIGLTDVNGDPFTLDDQGQFLINSVAWNVTNVSDTPGGYLVTLRNVDRKTIKRIPGNG